MQTMDLEEPNCLLWQRWEIYLARMAWLQFALIVLAGLAGAFGGGEVSRATSADESVIIEYGSIERYSAPAKIRVMVNNPGRAEICEVAFSDQFIKRVKIDEIKPQPLRTKVGTDRISFVFATENMAAFSIMCDYQHQYAGWHEFVIWVNGGESLRLGQWVFP